MDDTYRGRTLFIAGGAPSLLDEPALYKLAKAGISLMAMNNTATIFPAGVDFWVGCDKPACYSPSILLNPKPKKFAIIAKREFKFSVDQYREYRFLDCPNIYFFGTHDKWQPKTLLKKDRDFVWWKNTFWVALQIAYRLGFRKVYLVGCAFNIKDKEPAYSYDMTLDDYQRKYNQRLYNQTVTIMKQAKPHFDECGFEVISATKDSLLNEDYPYVRFDEAIGNALKEYPQDHALDKCKHSSEFIRKK